MQQAAFVSFLVDAEASPAILPRLLQPFARRDITPERMWSECSDSGMLVEIAVPAIPPDIICIVEGNLRQVVGVRRVSCVSASQGETLPAPSA